MFVQLGVPPSGCGLPIRIQGYRVDYMVPVSVSLMCPVLPDCGGSSFNQISMMSYPSDITVVFGEAPLPFQLQLVMCYSMMSYPSDRALWSSEKHSSHCSGIITL